MTKPLPAGQVASITLADRSAAVQDTGARGVQSAVRIRFSSGIRCASTGARDPVPGCTALTLGPRPGQPQALATERTSDREAQMLSSAFHSA